MPRDYVGHAIQIAAQRPDFLADFQKARAAEIQFNLLRQKAQLNNAIYAQFLGGQQPGSDTPDSSAELLALINRKRPQLESFVPPGTVTPRTPPAMGDEAPLPQSEAPM